MINKEIFESLTIYLKGDFVFQKVTFITSRVYGVLKMALYKMDSFFVELVYSIDSNTIEDIVFISETDLK